MPAKYLLISLSAFIFLFGCSGRNEGPTQSEAPLDTTEAVTEAVEEVEAAAEEGTDEPEEADAGDEVEIEDATADNTEEGDEEEIAGIDQRNVKLVIEDQTTAGQILVKEVATSRDGWVSIHKSQENGGILLPDSIGEARVDSGDSEEIIVDLWEAPEIGEKLWVLLHIDNGERGRYEFPEKDQAVRKNGETMARSFIIEDPNPDEDEDE